MANSGDPKSFGRRGVDQPSVPNAPAASRDTRYQDLSNRAAQAVLREFEESAVILAVILSVLNRAAPTEVVPFSLQAFRSTSPTCFIALRSELQEFGFLAETIAGLGRYYNAIEDARFATDEIANDMPEGFDQEWQASAIEVINIAADFALELVADLKKSKDHQSSAFEAPSPLLGPFLQSARDGQSPCWIAGRPTLPEWYDVRLTARHALNFPATLIYENRRDHVIVLCIGLTGMDVSPAPSCQIGQCITLVFDFGRQLDGVVVHKNDGYAVISLSSMLSHSDPLIAGR